MRMRLAMRCLPARRWILAMLCCMPATGLGYDVIFNTEEYPPFNYRTEDGDVAGISTQMLRQAIKEAGVTADFRLLPWARAYTEAKLRDSHCVYSTSRTPERESHFQWVGPLIVNEWAAFVRRGSEIDAARLDELAGLRVGSFREDAVGQFVEAQGIPIILAPTERENIHRLEAGLIDVWVSGDKVAQQLATEANAPIDKLFTFQRSTLYLACHPSVPTSVTERLQTSLDAMRQRGVHERIRRNVMERLERNR